MMIAVGIALAAVFVGGLTHPVSAQAPSTVASYDWHHRAVVIGFAVSMSGAAILVVTEVSRRGRRHRGVQPVDCTGGVVLDCGVTDT